MKKVFVVIGMLLAMCGLSFAESSFDTEVSGLRKSIISMCAQLQAGQPKESQEQLLKEIDGIINGWEKITATYKDNPPSQYAKDPAWKSYFAEALDNFQIMRQKAEGKDYQRAMQFCGMNCALFTTIYEVNGVNKITNKMFHLRKQLKMVVDTASTGNWTGAAVMLNNAIKLRDEVVKFPWPVGADKKEHSEMMKNLSKVVDSFAQAVNTKDIKEVKSKFGALLKVFGVIYIKYI